MPTIYVLINAELGSEIGIIEKIKEILYTDKIVKYQVQGVYGVYDIVLKIVSYNMDHLLDIIINKIRKINGISSTLTMIVTEG